MQAKWRCFETPFNQVSTQGVLLQPKNAALCICVVYVIETSVVLQSWLVLVHYFDIGVCMLHCLATVHCSATFGILLYRSHCIVLHLFIIELHCIKLFHIVLYIVL